MGVVNPPPALNLKVKTEKSYNNETAQKKRIDRGY